MASFLCDAACPECGRLAVEDYYYKIGESFIYCQCCGYKYSRYAKYDKDVGTYFEVKEIKGYGKFMITKKDGSFSIKLLNSPLTDEQIENYKREYEGIEVDRDKSFLVSYKDGKFDVLFGHVPDDFHLSFEEYIEKYGYEQF